MILNEIIKEEVEKVRKQYVVIHKGELPHAVHGVLLDPEKLESFLIAAMRRVADQTVENVVPKVSTIATYLSVDDIRHVDSSPFVAESLKKAKEFMEE